jgi:hypothetical protein
MERSEASWISLESSNPLGKTLAMIGMCVGGVGYAIYSVIKWIVTSFIDGHENFFMSLGAVYIANTLVKELGWEQWSTFALIIILLVTLGVAKELRKSS